ncbi:MAG: hypothetical protein JRD47_00110 [Deltaproteobacteria bacterium]|jgi:hypothetical protein|nr:hypothetical protein [Deltaproteobacteria bacterium]MBW2600323.1 hypothetical protein [Deltaproteobacteria bacterium]OEU46945.1 MAG: hypothetical protein BBJ60_05245 [Desulfobacterales bacterium S7086C20]
MTVKEVVLDIENRSGELSRIIAHLYENDVNVSAFWVSTRKTEATLRLIAGNPELASSVLAGLNLKATTSDAIALQVPNHPGGLNSVLKILSSADIDIVHIYPCLNTPDTILILSVDKTEQAVKALTDNWIKLYDEKLYKL